MSDPLDQLRTLCMTFPEAFEKEAWGEATFRAGEKGKLFATFANNHHDDGRIAVWCAAPPGAQDLLVDADPDTYFVPPYWGPSGWIGMRLDRDPDWDEVAQRLDDAYRTVARKRLIALLGTTSTPQE